LTAIFARLVLSKMDPVPGGQHARQTHLSRGISRLAHGLETRQSEQNQTNA